MKKLKGSITVFLLIITTVFVTLFTTLIDIIRVNSATGVAMRATYMFTSALENYTDSGILREYGFSVMDKELDDGKIGRIFDAIVSSNIDSRAMTDIDVTAGDILRLSLGETVGGAFNNDDVISIINKIGETENTIGDYKALYEVLDKMYSPKSLLSKYYEKLPYGAGNGTTFYSRISKLCLSGTAFITPSAQHSKIYSDRFSLVCDDNWSNEEWTFQNSYSPVVSTVIAENENALYQAYGDIVDNVWFYSSQGTAFCGVEAFAYDMNNAVVYMLGHFGTFYENNNTKPFNAQLEYIQFGKKSDRENLMCMLEKIYGYRYTMNLLSLVRETGNSSKEIIKRAEKEAALDVILLSQGKSVPLLKKVSQFNSTLNMSDEELIAQSGTIKSYEGSDAVSYKDYVVFGLYHCTNFEMLYSRIVDLISFDVQSNLKNRCVMVQVQCEAQVDYTPSSIAGFLELINAKEEWIVEN